MNMDSHVEPERVEGEDPVFSVVEQISCIYESMIIFVD